MFSFCIVNSLLKIYDFPLSNLINSKDALATKNQRIKDLVKDLRMLFNKSIVEIISFAIRKINILCAEY